MLARKIIVTILASPVLVICLAFTIAIVFTAIAAMPIFTGICLAKWFLQKDPDWGLIVSLLPYGLVLQFIIIDGIWDTNLEDLVD